MKKFYKPLIYILIIAIALSLIILAIIKINKDSSNNDKYEEKSLVSKYVDDVPIPEGFKVSEVQGENLKADGLVIKDEHENEFVWIPVKDLNPDGTTDGKSYDKQFGRRTFGRMEKLGGIEEKANRYTEVLPKELVDSVEKYGGFYIARYEASYEDGNVAVKKGTEVYPMVRVSKPKENGQIWNYISQRDAVQACKDMYSSNEAVVSHLPYGAEWDSMLEWIIESGMEASLIAQDSNSWGNYNDTEYKYAGDLLKEVDVARLLNSGEITEPEDRNQKNNIYDIAGNLSEWTQEKYTLDKVRTTIKTEDDLYALRGGHYASESVRNPAAHRQRERKENKDYVMGFRPALYIK